MWKDLYCVSLCAALVVAAPVVRAEPAESPASERIKQLEKRIEQLERDPSRAAPATGTPGTTSSAFNPAISLILNGTLASFSRDPDRYTLPGFALAAETGPGREGLSLGESEIVMSANIDDRFHGRFTAALTPENEIEVEEAFFETLTLGHGFTLRAGRFYSGIGYLNSVHTHAWDFTDQPLVYRAMFGNQYGDDGVQLRWVAPTDVFLEFGAELFRGENFPAGGAANGGRGASAFFVRIGGDVGVEHAWRIGLSRLKARADDRATGDEAAPDVFNGDSTLTGVDFVWKWAPNGNARERNFKLQAETFRRDEDGDFDPASIGSPVRYRGSQSGWYAQGVYQFMPQWRVGLRHDRLAADAVGVALAGTVLDKQNHEPRRTSLMLDFSHSEYSRLRLQYNHDESRPDQSDRQWYLQYTMSLGAHGAHTF